MSKDRIYERPRPQIVDFVFDETVASVFPDMIRRSVPGYELVVPMTGLLAARHLAAQHLHAASSPKMYDLGCSLGATTLATLRALDALAVAPSGLVIQAVDNSAAMLKEAGNSIHDERVRFTEADIRELALEACDVVTMNWILQFLPPEDRVATLTRIRAALKPGGLLIVSEKIRFEEDAQQAFNESAHLDFKLANGYSDLEISQKRSALDRVMILDTQETHLRRFEQAGFDSARVWFQCLNWASFLVIA
jgi:tRNA (cmo5U34)-methyltransferase